MSLAQGTKLGPYEILSPIGAGGMGEVYRARDPRVGRDVAIKVSSEQFSDRFTREIHAVAALNHSNVCTLFDVGPNYLVMELVEGPTLADRIKQGPIPLEESLGIAKQIADALEAAHEKGIVHRDLKPGNIKLRPDGTVKVLDFGLAKVEEAAAISLETSPTLSVAQTAAGVLLGTAAYMSPEQARGKPVDKRADIWAFGVVLYEMLTGRQLFTGETVSDTLASTLKEEPDFEEVPAKVRPLLLSCLEKNPSRRLRDIGDGWRLLESAPQSETMKRPWFLRIWAATATLLLIALAITAFLRFRGSEPAEAMRLQITVPSMPSDYFMAMSPDGRRIAFAAMSSGSVPSLFIREIGSVIPRKIEGTDGARSPFWSPDSQSIAFSAGGRLKRVDVSGKPLPDICAAGNKTTGGTWNSDGVVIFADYPILRRVSVEDGRSADVTILDKSRKEISHFFPSFLPDGRHYLYTAMSGTTSKANVYLGSLESNEQARLLIQASMAVYAEPGYLIFQRERALFAQPFDAKSFTFAGKAAIIAEDLLVSSFYGIATVSASKNGLLIYRAETAQAGSQYVWFDRTGNQLGPAGDPAMNYLRGFDLSPDGKRIAAPRFDPQTRSAAIWLIECERNIAAPLTFDSAFHACVVWSPDGRQIAITSNPKGSWDIFLKNASGIGEEIPLAASADNEWMKDWSRDGRYIAYGTSSEALFALPLFGDRKPFPIVQSPANLNMPSFSYDGKWLAYNCDESGMWQVYVIPFPAADPQKWQISTTGGAQPRWRSDGKELYYLTPDGKMMAVEIRTDQGIQSGTPEMLFDTKLVVDPTNNQYEVTSDGRRFLLLKSLSEATPTPITVVSNWTALLKK